jgi:hypothetical protein
MGDGIPDADTMTVEDAHREGSIRSQDIFLCLRPQRAARDIILAPCDIEHGAIAKNETEREQGLRTGAIMIIRLIRTLDAAGCAITDAANGGPLKCHVLGEPGLPVVPRESAVVETRNIFQRATGTLFSDNSFEGELIE